MARQSVDQAVETLSVSSSSTHVTNNYKGKRPARFDFTDSENAIARGIYVKLFLRGCFLVVLAIFAYLSIYWGALWKTPTRNLQGWVVDFDGSTIGQTVVQALTSTQVSQSGKVTWTAVPASQFASGLEGLGHAVREQHTWAAVAIHEGATQRLQASFASPNASYSPTEAITVYASEARNENAYRTLLRPSAQTALDQITQHFALTSAQELLSSGADITSILRTSPQTVLTPISYTIDNLVPFDVPVATAITFVGLIYQLILAFVIVNIGAAARDASGLSQKLNTRSLIFVRLASSFVAYFFVSLFYALLSLAFQVDFSRKFGHGGFVIFWMLNWAGMLAGGLAIESLLTLLTARFIPFFLILWVISNVAVSSLPIEVLPTVFRYGYVAPFYNVSKAARTIVFGTKNSLATNFAVLIVWIAISSLTLPLIQMYVRRRDDGAAQAVADAKVEEELSRIETESTIQKDEKDIGRIA